MPNTPRAAGLPANKVAVYSGRGSISLFHISFHDEEFGINAMYFTAQGRISPPPLRANWPRRRGRTRGDL